MKIASSGVQQTERSRAGWTGAGKGWTGRLRLQYGSTPVAFTHRPPPCTHQQPDLVDALHQGCHLFRVCTCQGGMEQCKRAVSLAHVR